MDRPTFGAFPLGLTAAEEARAARLHHEALIIDLMFQGPCGHRSLGPETLVEQQRKWAQTGSGDLFVETLQLVNESASNGALKDFEACWKGSGLTGSNLQIISNHRKGHHDARLREMRNNGDWYGQATRSDDFRAAKAAGRCVSFLNYQNVPPEIDDVAFFDEAAALNVKMIGLTYNHPNAVGAGCTSPDPGLTPFGREVVARMNALGMIVDVAHAGKGTTLDACRVSTAPVIASHTGAEAVFPHDRCKSDDELKAIAGTGGVIGVVAVPGFLTHDLPGTISLMFDHIDYIANLVGVDAVAIGTDWPMQLPSWVLEPGGPFEQWTRDMGFPPDSLAHLDLNLEGFDDYRDYPNITRGLVKRGYGDDDIAKILGGNALRVISAVWS